MATKVETYLIDDLDGGPADEIVTFSLDGQDLQIDLSARNAAKLRQTLARYIEHGTRVRAVAATRPGNGRSRTGRGISQERNTAIRAWAAERGIEVRDRGRIKQEIVDQYDAAQREPAPEPETTNGSRSRRRRRVAADAG